MFLYLVYCEQYSLPLDPMSEVRSGGEREISAGAREGKAVERRRVETQRALLKKAFGEGLSDSTFDVTKDAPTDEVASVANALKAGGHVPAGLREISGWKRWAGENKAHNFVVLSAAARKSGIDRFSATALAGVIFGKEHSMGAGGGKLDSVAIRVNAAVGTVDVDLAYQYYGDVREKKSKPRAETRTVSVSVTELASHRLPGLSGSRIDKQRVSAALSSEDAGFANYDRETGTIIATRKVETESSLAFRPVAVLEADELLTPAEIEMVQEEIVIGSGKKTTIEEILTDKGQGWNTEGWIDLNQVARSARSLENLATLSEGITGSRQERSVAAASAKARSEQTLQVHALIESEVLGVLQQALKQKVGAEKQAASGFLSGLWRAVADIGRSKPEPLTPQAITAVLSKVAKNEATKVPVSFREEVTGVRLLQSMASADHRYLVADVKMTPRVERFSVEMTDPRPGHETEKIIVEVSPYFAEHKPVTVQAFVNETSAA